MKLHFTDEQMRAAIARDPDEAEYEAGSSHYDAPRPRFFIEHGVIHDRATGKHVRTCDCLAPLEDGIEAACGLLNSLADSSASHARTIEALRATVEPFANEIHEGGTMPDGAELVWHLPNGTCINCDVDVEDFHNARRALKEHPNESPQRSYADKASGI